MERRISDVEFDAVWQRG